MEKEANIRGYRAVVISLIAILICSNVIQFNMNSDMKNRYEDSLDYVCGQLSSFRATEAIELDHFADELDLDYIYVKSIEPIGFINYTTITDATGDTCGFISILYEVTFDKITKEEANGSIEVWERNYTYDGVFTFDDAVANDFKPMQTGKIYRMYSLYKHNHFFSIIYYEQVETSKIDW